MFKEARQVVLDAPEYIAEQKRQRAFADEQAMRDKLHKQSLDNPLTGNEVRNILSENRKAEDQNLKNAKKHRQQTQQKQQQTAKETAEKLEVQDAFFTKFIALRNTLFEIPEFSKKELKLISHITKAIDTYTINT